MPDNKITIDTMAYKLSDYEPVVLSGAGTLTDLYNKVKEAYDKCENPDKVIVGSNMYDIYQYFDDNNIIDDECDDLEFLSGADPIKIS